MKAVMFIIDDEGITGQIIMTRKQSEDFAELVKPVLTAILGEGDVEALAVDKPIKLRFRKEAKK